MVIQRLENMRGQAANDSLMQLMLDIIVEQMVEAKIVYIRSSLVIVKSKRLRVAMV